MRLSFPCRLLIGAVIAVGGTLVVFVARKPHILEFAHYYTGAKYFREVGYTGLYEALTGALAEIYGEEALAEGVPVVRGLDGGGFLSPSDTLKVFQRKRDRWTPKRWGQFVEDVRFLDSALDRYSDKEPLRHWRTILRDYGYNAPPPYTAVVSPVANLVPLSWSGLILLCSVDVVLLAVVFLLLADMFGPFRASIGFLFFASSLDMLSYVTWALFRFDWLLAMALGFWILGRERYFLSGVSWGVAALLRIFPGLIAAFAVLVWILGAHSRPQERRGIMTFVFGVGCGAVLTAFLSTVALAGWRDIPTMEPWGQFLRRITAHAASGGMLNGVGIGKIFETFPFPGDTVAEPVLTLALALALVLILVRRGGPPEEKAVLAVFCAPLFLYLSHYYYLMLLFPAALNDRTSRYAMVSLVAVNLAVGWGLKAGMDYYRLLDSQCLAYSFILVMVPAAMYLGKGRSEAGRTSLSGDT